MMTNYPSNQSQIYNQYYGTNTLTNPNYTTYNKSSTNSTDSNNLCNFPPNYIYLYILLNLI